MAQAMRFHPTTCTCHPVSFGSVKFFDSENGNDIIHVIASKVVRRVTCPVHGNEPRCSSRYLGKFLSRA